jgi:hypothetical protein
MIGLGYGLAAFAKLLTAWQLVLLARCTDRLGKGIRGAPRDAPAGRRSSSAPLGNPMSDRSAGSDPASCAK